MKRKNKITILGDGGWGTALAIVAARNGNRVVLWSAFRDYAEYLQKKRENKKFLPGIKIPKPLVITSDLEEAVKWGDLLVFAIPTQYLRNVLYRVKNQSLNGKTLVSVAKGIEGKTGLRPSEIIYAMLGRQISLTVLSGPSHAEEVVRKVPTIVVAASSEDSAARRVQEAFGNPCFRIYLQNDMIGAELGGALKNVIAIAAGVCDGLKFGANTKAGLISRGLVEMVRLGVRLGANPNTFFGLSGMGDLITTCFSPYGRNLRVGRELGEGKSIEKILSKTEMIAEGVPTAKSVYELAQKLKLELPVMREVYRLLYEKKNPRRAVADLLNRPAANEMKAG